MDLKQYYENALFLEDGFQDMIQSSEDFYNLTLKRDQAFINNMLQVLNRRGDRPVAPTESAVLITGGYHTPNLKKLLKERGISYVVLTPTITHETNTKRYEQILLNQKPSPLLTKNNPQALATPQAATLATGYGPFDLTALEALSKEFPEAANAFNERKESFQSLIPKDSLLTVSNDFIQLQKEPKIEIASEKFFKLIPQTITDFLARERLGKKKGILVGEIGKKVIRAFKKIEKGESTVSESFVTVEEAWKSSKGARLASNPSFLTFLGVGVFGFVSFVGCAVGKEVVAKESQTLITKTLPVWFKFAFISSQTQKLLDEILNSGARLSSGIHLKPARNLYRNILKVIGEEEWTRINQEYASHRQMAIDFLVSLIKNTEKYNDTFRRGAAFSLSRINNQKEGGARLTEGENEKEDKFYEGNKYFMKELEELKNDFRNYLNLLGEKNWLSEEEKKIGSSFLIAFSYLENEFSKLNYTLSLSRENKKEALRSKEELSHALRKQVSGMEHAINNIQDFFNQQGEFSQPISKFLRERSLNFDLMKNHLKSHFPQKNPKIGPFDKNTPSSIENIFKNMPSDISIGKITEMFNQVNKLFLDLKKKGFIQQGEYIEDQIAEFNEAAMGFHEALRSHSQNRNLLKEALDKFFKDFEGLMEELRRRGRPQKDGFGEGYEGARLAETELGEAGRELEKMIRGLEDLVSKGQIYEIDKALDNFLALVKKAKEAGLSEDDKIRKNASAVLERIQWSGEERAPRKIIYNLQSLLEHTNAPIVVKAALSLVYLKLDEELGTKALEALYAANFNEVKPLKKEIALAAIFALKNGFDPEFKNQASYVLNRVAPELGPDTKNEIVPSLIEMLSDAQYQKYAAAALGHFGHEARSSVPLLIEIIQKEGYQFVEERLAAVKALGEMGVLAREALPFLEAIKKDKTGKTWVQKYEEKYQEKYGYHLTLPSEYSDPAAQLESSAKEAIEKITGARLASDFSESFFEDRHFIGAPEGFRGAFERWYGNLYVKKDLRKEGALKERLALIDLIKKDILDTAQREANEANTSLKNYKDIGRIEVKEAGHVIKDFIFNSYKTDDEIGREIAPHLSMAAKYRLSAADLNPLDAAQDNHELSLLARNAERVVGLMRLRYTHTSYIRKTIQADLSELGALKLAIDTILNNVLRLRPEVSSRDFIQKDDPLLKEVSEAVKKANLLAGKAGIYLLEKQHSLDSMPNADEIAHITKEMQDFLKEFLDLENKLRGNDSGARLALSGESARESASEGDLPVLKEENGFEDWEKERLEIFRWSLKKEVNDEKMDIFTLGELDKISKMSTSDLSDDFVIKTFDVRTKKKISSVKSIIEKFNRLASGRLIFSSREKYGLHNFSYQFLDWTYLTPLPLTNEEIEKIVEIVHADKGKYRDPKKEAQGFRAFLSDEEIQNVALVLAMQGFEFLFNDLTYARVVPVSPETEPIALFPIYLDNSLTGSMKARFEISLLDIPADSSGESAFIDNLNGYLFPSQEWLDIRTKVFSQPKPGDSKKYQKLFESFDKIAKSGLKPSKKLAKDFLKTWFVEDIFYAVFEVLADHHVKGWERLLRETGFGSGIVMFRQAVSFNFTERKILEQDESLMRIIARNSISDDLFGIVAGLIYYPNNVYRLFGETAHHAYKSFFEAKIIPYLENLVESQKDIWEVLSESTKSAIREKKISIIEPNEITESGRRWVESKFFDNGSRLAQKKNKIQEDVGVLSVNGHLFKIKLEDGKPALMDPKTGQFYQTTHLQEPTARVYGINFNLSGKDSTSKLFDLLLVKDWGEGRWLLSNPSNKKIIRLSPFKKLSGSMPLKEEGDYLIPAPSGARLSQEDHDRSQEIQKFIQDLKGGSFNNRSKAIKALAKIGSSAVQALTQILKDKDPEVCSASAQALGLMGSEASLAVSALIEGFKNKNMLPLVRSNFAKALGLIGPRDKAVISILIEASKDENFLVKSAAKAALEKIKKEAGTTLIETSHQAKPNISTLIEALVYKDSYIRSDAAEALGEIGHKAKSAIPVLTQTLKDEDRDLRLSAAKALLKIDPEIEDSIPYLIWRLRDEAQSYPTTLKKLVEFGSQAVPALIEALEDRDDHLRCAAAKALGEIGPEAKLAIPALIKALEDENFHVRLDAAEALGEIGKSIYSSFHDHYYSKPDFLSNFQVTESFYSYAASASRNDPKALVLIKVLEADQGRNDLVLSEILALLARKGISEDPTLFGHILRDNGLVFIAEQPLEDILEKEDEQRDVYTKAQQALNSIRSKDPQPKGGARLALRPSSGQAENSDKRREVRGERKYQLDESLEITRRELMRWMMVVVRAIIAFLIPIFSFDQPKDTIEDSVPLAGIGYDEEPDLVDGFYSMNEEILKGWESIEKSFKGISKLRNNLIISQNSGLNSISKGPQTPDSSPPQDTTQSSGIHEPGFLDVTEEDKDNLMALGRWADDGGPGPRLVGESVTFLVKIYDATQTTGQLAVDRTVFQIKEEKGELVINGFGKELLRTKGYQKIARESDDHEVTVSMADYQLALEQANQIIEEALPASSLDELEAVAVIDVDSLNPGAWTFETLIAPLLAEEAKLSQGLPWGKKGKFLLEGDKSLVEKIMSRLKESYPGQNFVFDGEENLPENYRQAPRILITAKPEKARLDIRYFFLEALKEGSVPNIRGAFKAAFRLARIKELNVQNPQFTEARDFITTLVGFSVNETELIHLVEEGHLISLEIIQKYRLPEITRLSLNKLAQGARLVLQMTRQSA
jgi:HEAT repeat protein